MGKHQALTSLFFDLDDTLVDAETAYAAAMRTIGIEPEDASFLKARALVKACLPPLQPVARSRQLYFKKYLELNGQFSAKRHFELAEGYEQAVITHMEEQWKRLRRLDLFEKIKAKYPTIFIVTNETTRLQLLKLFKFDPNSKIFSGILTSEECGFEKPRPEIYNLALQRAGCTAGECVMIGDSFVNDVQGAINCGIKSIQTTEFTKPKELGPIVISDLNELPDTLKSLNL